MKKVIVGITGSLLIDPTGRFENYWKSYVNDDYISSVLKAGAIPYIIPVSNDKNTIKQQIKNVDAIIFSGGDDIHPKTYKEKILPKCEKPNDRRDFFDLELARLAKKYKKPTLAICRGHQIQVVQNKGALHQDLTYVKKNTLEHMAKSTPEFISHKIKISKKSLLYSIIKKKKIGVNSFHHQIVKDVPKGFKITAISKDGVIEAVEYRNPKYFFLSVQWHPEMMTAKGDKDMLKLFKRLIKEAKK